MLTVLAELSNIAGWFGIYYDGPPVFMSLLKVTITLAPIGSAGVGQLADYFMGRPWLKWVVPLEMPSPLDPAASLVDRCLYVDRVKRGRSVVVIGAFVSPTQCPMVSWTA